jgi:hypothetical protein
MSAYVVDPKVINAIVSAIESAIRQEGRYPTRFPDLRYLKSQTIRDAVQADPAEFGRTLYAMNVNAVEQRYPGDKEIPGTYSDGEKLDAYTYKRIPSDMINKYQAYKSLGCYLYQCTEGDVDQLTLYKDLCELKAAMAEHFVENSDEYEKAAWG